MASAQENSAVGQETQQTKAPRPRWHRLVLIVMLGLACAFAFWFGNDHHQPPPNAGLVVRESALDFGEVWETPEFHCKLPIHNPTEKAIEIKEFAASCGCASIKPAGLKLAPNETRQVQLTLDLSKVAKFSDNNAIKKFGVRLIPEITDSRVRHKGWILQGKVKRALAFSPPIVDFGELVHDGTVPITIITVKEFTPINKIIAAVNPPLGTVKIVEKSKNNSKRSHWGIQIAPSQDLPIGIFHFRIKLKAYLIGVEQHENPQVFSLYCHGRVTNDIQPVPDTVLLGALAIGKSTSATVTFYSKTGQPFAVHPSRRTASGIKIQPITQKELLRHSFRLIVRIDGQGNQCRTVIFHGKNKNGNDIEIPLNVRYFGLK